MDIQGDKVETWLYLKTGQRERLEQEARIQSAERNADVKWYQLIQDLIDAEYPASKRKARR